MRTRSLALTGVLSLVGQALILAVLYAVASEQPPIVAGVSRDLILAALAVAQSAIWVAFFYVQDRLQPEPIRYVVTAFLAGMAGGAILAVPLERTIFLLPEWMHRSNVDLLLAAACVRGAIALIILFVIIRHGFQRSNEFDEPADGMAYGAFIGCGLAAVRSLAYLALHRDFTLFAAAHATATNVLVYASVGAFAGYLIGSTKFTTRPARFAGAAAILLGAGLIGLYHVIVENAIVSGASNGLWTGAGAAMVFALVVLGLSTILMNQLTKRASAPQVASVPRFDFPAFVVGVGLLAVGAWAAYTNVRPVVFHDATHAIRFAYDPTVATSAAGFGTSGVTQAAFSRPAGPSDLPSVFTARTRQGATLTVQARDGALDLQQFLPEPFLRASDPIGLSVTESLVGGQRAVRLVYAYQLYPPRPSPELPRLRWVTTTVVPNGAHTYAISFEAEPDAFTAGESFYQQVLSSITWSAQAAGGGPK